MTFISTSNGAKKSARGRDRHHVSAFYLIPPWPKKNGAGKCDRGGRHATGNAPLMSSAKQERGDEQEAEVGRWLA
jgi:hypothetical protein